MMASQGPTIETAAPADPNSLEKYQGDGSQVHALSYYPSTTGSASVPWSTYATDKPTTGYGSVPNSSYQHDQQTEQHLTNVQNPSNVTSLASSNPGTDTTSQVYTGYATYQTPSNPYSYAKTGYSSYYSDYQQPPNQPYSQPVGVYQNSVAPYQPHSSYQNTGSYAGTAGYSSTYYNPGDYQTPGTYTGSGYSNQTNTWSQGNYAHYSQQYPSYSQDSSSSYSSNLVAASVPDYQQQYKQWVDYYNQTEVTCAPGTENTTVPSTSSLSCPIPGVSSGYSTPPVSQPQPSYTPSWKPEYGSSTLPSVQTGPSVNAQDGYWQHGAQPFQNPYLSSAQPSAQNPVNVNPTYPSVQEPQQMSLSTPSSSQYPSAHPVQHTYQQLLPSAHQVQQIHQQPTQSPPFMDARRVNKLQIPTNPRIASNLGLGLQKTEKDGSATGVAAKPAYVSVSVARPNDKVLSSNASDPILKPGMFPASLRGYVERALARCKDEKQMAACQEIMKEMITKATTDGTLHARDWDMEPLFPLPDASTVNKEDGATSVHSLPKFKRSPSRRTKSRWEPLPEEKLNDKSALSNQDSAKSGGWHHFNGRNKFTTGKFESKDGIDNKFSALEQTSPSKSAQKPVKRRRFGRELSSVENGDASSGSDKEQDLTAYYSGAISLADSPEERKRRENRSKRFERTNGQRSANHFRPKTAGAGNLYTRRATALVLSKNFEDAGSRAVEDIDWDALTVKGTCQEIEKRYLRLTSAPDPSTVRPEEVLEKALHMVHNSQKNYLYKCDQLKSIRQDLTVQRIRNELTVKVYETHARLALEFGDLPEYNQCQSQLKSLYGEGIAGCHMEFSAYNLLAVILHSYNRKELLSLMSRLSDEAKRHESVKHALKVRAAVTSGNYVMFFRLYKTAPNLNTYLMDLCVEKMRFEAVKSMSRAYRPTVPVSYITQVLGFSPSPDIEGAEEKDVESMEECTEWLKAHGACLITDNNGELQLDTKASASSLYMPEPEDAVAHGDANLAVNDFLTRTPI